MKISFSEHDGGASMFFTPETIAEATQLARLAHNAAKKPAHIKYYMSKGGAYATIWLPKKHRSKQSNVLG